MQNFQRPFPDFDIIGAAKVRSAVSALRRFDELSGSAVIRASFVQRSFSPHTHETWTIGWVERGANRFRRGRAEFVASAGTVCVVNPGEAHTGGGDAMTYWDLMPSHALLGRIFPRTPLDSLFLRDAVIVQEPALRAVRRMFASIANAHSSMAVEQAAVDGLAALFTSGAKLAPDDVRRDALPLAALVARDFIEAHIDAPVSLAMLAAETGLSLFHFCRVFEAAHGMPPAAYVRNRRVHRAGRLITGGMPLAQVAACAGFSDQAHMNRQFRAVLGVTPAQWRA